MNYDLFKDAYVKRNKVTPTDNTEEANLGAYDDATVATLFEVVRDHYLATRSYAQLAAPGMGSPTTDIAAIRAAAASDPDNAKQNDAIRMSALYDGNYQDQTLDPNDPTQNQYGKTRYETFTELVTRAGQGEGKHGWMDPVDVAATLNMFKNPMPWSTVDGYLGAAEKTGPAHVTELRRRYPDETGMGQY